MKARSWAADKDCENFTNGVQRQLYLLLGRKLWSPSWLTSLYLIRSNRQDFR